MSLIDKEDYYFYTAEKTNIKSPLKENHSGVFGFKSDINPIDAYSDIIDGLEKKICDSNSKIYIKSLVFLKTQCDVSLSNDETSLSKKHC